MRPSKPIVRLSSKLVSNWLALVLAHRLLPFKALKPRFKLAVSSSKRAKLWIRLSINSSCNSAVIRSKLHSSSPISRWALARCLGPPRPQNSLAACFRMSVSSMMQSALATPMMGCRFIPISITAITRPKWVLWRRMLRRSILMLSVRLGQLTVTCTRPSITISWTPKNALMAAA